MRETYMKPNCRFKILKNAKGYTLLEIIIALGLTFVLAAAVAVAFSNFSLNTKQNKMRLARQSLFLDIKSQIVKPQLLHWAAQQAGNEDLLKCTAPPSTGGSPSAFNAADCYDLTSGNPKPLTLYSLNTTNKIAEGDIADPTKGIRYTFEGVQCPSASASCPIIVRAFFKPVCRVNGYSISGYTISTENRCKNTTPPANSYEAPIATNQIYDIQIHFRISAELSSGDSFPFKTITSLPATVTAFGATNAAPIPPFVINAVRIGNPKDY